MVEVLRHRLVLVGHKRWKRWRIEWIEAPLGGRLGMGRNKKQLVAKLHSIQTLFGRSQSSFRDRIFLLKIALFQKSNSLLQNQILPFKASLTFPRTSRRKCKSSRRSSPACCVLERRSRCAWCLSASPAVIASFCVHHRNGRPFVGPSSDHRPFDSDRSNRDVGEIWWHHDASDRHLSEKVVD